MSDMFLSCGLSESNYVPPLLNMPRTLTESTHFTADSSTTQQFVFEAEGGDEETMTKNYYYASGEGLPPQFVDDFQECEDAASSRSCTTSSRSRSSLLALRGGGPKKVTARKDYLLF